MERTLTARIETRGIDAKAGTFPMILATEGEASDGSILSIRGGHIPERMPLLNSHFNDPSAALGSVIHPRKDLKANPAQLRAIGQIELEGEGTMADIRRDLFHMIRAGHIDSVSIRWDDIPGKTTRRTNLPSDHFAAVDSDEPDWRKREGFFFEQWEAREGSVVALGADKAAKMRARAEETEGDVSNFWRGMAIESETDALDPDEKLYEDLLGLGWTPPESRATQEEPAELPVEALETEPIEEPSIVPARPRVRWEPGEVARALSAAIEQRDETLRAELQALIDKARGRVTPCPTNSERRPSLPSR